MKPDSNPAGIYLTVRVGERVEKFGPFDNVAQALAAAAEERARMAREAIPSKGGDRIAATE
jgi:hypothetical protein